MSAGLVHSCLWVICLLHGFTTKDFYHFVSTSLYNHYENGSLASVVQMKGVQKIAIAFNGGTAARLGRRSLSPRSNLHLIDLPSSSPAYTRPLAEKAAA